MTSANTIDAVCSMVAVARTCLGMPGRSSPQSRTSRNRHRSRIRAGAAALRSGLARSVRDRGGPATLRGARRRRERPRPRGGGAGREGPRGRLPRAVAHGLRARRRPGVPGRSGAPADRGGLCRGGLGRARRRARRGERAAVHRGAADRWRGGGGRLSQGASGRRRGGPLRAGRRAGRHRGRRPAARARHLPRHGDRVAHRRDRPARRRRLRGGSRPPAGGARGAGRARPPHRRGVRGVRRLRELRRTDRRRVRGDGRDVDDLVAGRPGGGARRERTRRGRASAGGRRPA